MISRCVVSTKTCLSFNVGILKSKRDENLKTVGLNLHSFDK